MYRRQSETNARLPHYRSILVASRHMHSEFEAHRIAPERLHRLPLPLPDADTSSAPAGKSSSGRILFLGRLTDLKGAANLVRAVAYAGTQLARQLKLTVAGDGAERRNVEQLARELSLDAEFTGWMESAAKRELLRQTDLLAVPSLWPEPFGLVGVEAQCLGVPAVAYDVGGISDWLVPGVTGELAPGNPPTVEGLASAIVRALVDPRHYQALSMGAWRKSREFTLEAHLSLLEPLLTGIAAEVLPQVFIPTSRASL